MQLSEGIQKNWNRIAIMVASVAVLLLFSRAAVFPAHTFWELSFTKYLSAHSDSVFCPGYIPLVIAQSSVSLLGLKAVYHILFFLLCTKLLSYIFKGREITPGLTVLCVFTLFMQSVFSIRQIILMFSVLLMTDIFQSKGKAGALVCLEAFAITAYLTASESAGWIMILFAFCFAFFKAKGVSPLLIASVVIGVIAFPYKLAAYFNPKSLFSRDIIIPEDRNLVLFFALGFMICCLFMFSKYKNLRRFYAPLLWFYSFSGIISFFDFRIIPVFMIMGMVLFLMGCSKIQPLSDNFHMLSIVVMTLFVNIFLFVHPAGMKLNSTVYNQIGRNFMPIVMGSTENMLISGNEVGEVLWRGFIDFDEGSLNSYFKIKDWKLSRTDGDTYYLSPALEADIE